MARGAPQVFRNFGKGLNTQEALVSLDSGESPDCLNVRGTVRGAIRKREGMMDLSSGTDFVSQTRKLAVYRQGATTRLVALGSKLQALEPGGVPGSAYTPVTTNPWSWTSAIGQPVGSPLQGPLFLMSDSDKLVFNGTTFSAWTAATGVIPTGRIMEPHQNRLFVADVSAPTDSRTAIIFSEIGDYRTWPVQNIVKFDPFEGDRITALCSLGQYLMVFKAGGIWRVYDGDTGANTKITEDAGTVFRDSVVGTDQGCFFLDPDRGVMVTDGSNVRVVSDAILPELRGIPLGDEATFNVCAAYWEGSYWLSIPNTAGAPVSLLEYDLQDKVWWRHDCAAYDLKVTSFGQSADPLLVRDALVGAVPGSVLQNLGVASAARSRVFQLLRPHTSADQVSGQDPKPVAFRWRSAPATLDGNDHVGKRLAQLRVSAVGSASVMQLRNYSTAPESLGTLETAGGAAPGLWGVEQPGLWGVDDGRGYVWGGAGDIAESRFQSLGVARTWQLEVQGLSVSEFELDSYAVLVGPRPRRD